VLRAPILVDAATAARIRERLPSEVARCRRLAVVRPVGFDAPVEVSELWPPGAEDPRLADTHLADYEAALDAFQAGDWQKAFELLHRVPAEDQAKDFLTVFIAQHDRTPPDAWDGVIPLTSK
jgi:adenylate cyclase